MTALTYQQAVKEVRERVAASRTSFSAGMMILPKDRREAMYALYAFCREVDDIADDGETPEARQRGLQEWREKIHALFHEGHMGDSITRVLAVAIERFGLIEDDFQAIIDGMAMDADAPICAPRLATLDLYCDRVASAVGRASVRIFGDASANGLRVAHHLGRAFQLTNILRDLGEDAARGRLYLPAELLVKHNIASREPESVLRDPHLPDVCRDLAALAQTHFTEADAAMRVASPEAMKPARLMRLFYGAILDRLIAADWRNSYVRASLSALDKWLLIARFLIGNWRS